MNKRQRKKRRKWALENIKNYLLEKNHDLYGRLAKERPEVLERVKELNLKIIIHSLTVVNVETEFGHEI